MTTALAPAEPPDGETAVALYAEAKVALARCQRIDEAKHFTAQAATLAYYGRLSKDTSLIDTAIRLQARAERRMGEISSAIPTAAGGRPPETLPTRGKSFDAPAPEPPETKRAVLRRAGISTSAAARAERIAALPEPRFEELVEAAKPPSISELLARANGEKPKAPHTAGTGEEHWYTPPEIIEAARAALGGEITLDPCSSDAAQAAVRAGRYLTEADDALDPRTPWAGLGAERAFLNPPYRNKREGGEDGKLTRFAERLAAELDAGTVAAAIWLSNSITETRAAQLLFRRAVGVCFPARRLHFRDERLQPSGSNPQGSMLIAFGDVALADFEAAFGKYGAIFAPHAGAWTGQEG